MNKRDFERGNANLLRLAGILRAVDMDARTKLTHEPLYGQTRWTHICGAPSCALGWWAAHNRSRWRTVVPMICNQSECSRRGEGPHAHDLGTLERLVSHDLAKRLRKTDMYVPATLRLDPFEGAKLDFCLTPREADELFNGDGCGNARTNAEHAAEYIENFVARRERAREHVA